MKKYIFLMFLSIMVFPVIALGGTGVQTQQLVLKGEKNFITEHPTHNLDGTINVIVEMPAGTSGQYSVDKKSGLMALEQQQGDPQYLQYLPYPANYGFIPRTMLAKEFGGNGNPLSAIVLGSAVPRGAVLKARPLGVLNFNEHGSVNSKIVLAAVGSPFEKIHSIKGLDDQFPGVLQILQTWFVSSSGKDKAGNPLLSNGGVQEKPDAIRKIGDAALRYERSHVSEADKPKLDPNGNPYMFFSPQARNIGD